MDQSGYYAQQQAPGYPPPQQAAAPGYPPPVQPAPAGQPGAAPAGAYDPNAGYGGAYAGYAGYDPSYAAGYGPGYGRDPYGPPMRGRGPMMGYGPANRWAAVRLRGLPFGVHEHEINLFLGLDSADVLMVRRGGRATGEAFVLLTHPADMDVALRKNRAYMGSRYIEVFEAGRQEYYKACAAAVGYDGPSARAGSPEGGRSRSRSPLPGRGEIGPTGPPEHNGTNILKLRGLPYSATAHDVVAFFEDPSLGIPAVDADKVILPVGPDGRASGLAFVEFDTPESAAMALRKDRQTMGSRYVECFPSTPEERQRYQ
eukprot:scaffold8.g1584.t1